jgi:hypothetical protein
MNIKYLVLGEEFISPLQVARAYGLNENESKLGFLGDDSSVNGWNNLPVLRYCSDGDYKAKKEMVDWLIESGFFETHRTIVRTEYISRAVWNIQSYEVKK